MPIEFSSVKLAGDLIVEPEEIYPVVFTRRGDIFLGVRWKERAKLLPSY